MKLLRIAFMLFSFTHFTIAQSKTIEKEESLPNQTKEHFTSPLFFKFKKYDFGKIPKGMPVSVDFIFKNVSDKPVIIESATAQCGCTTPVFPKSGIAAGDSNRISITYNAANPGVFMKQVTLKLLRYDEPVYLVVSGQVMPSEPYKKTE